MLKLKGNVAQTYTHFHAGFGGIAHRSRYIARGD